LETQLQREPWCSTFRIQSWSRVPSRRFRFSFSRKYSGFPQNLFIAHFAKLLIRDLISEHFPEYGKRLRGEHVFRPFFPLQGRSCSSTNDTESVSLIYLSLSSASTVANANLSRICLAVSGEIAMHRPLNIRGGICVSPHKRANALAKAELMLQP
jgi:hypothetical protein